MTKHSKQNFSITTLSKLHKRQSFCCGVDSLDHYLHKQAGQDNRKHISVTYVLSKQEKNNVIAYYTLSSTTIELAHLPKELTDKLPHYPLLSATLIGRFAVDIKHQKLGLGEILLIDALYRSYRASQEVASFAILVEASNATAASFYKKYNFSSLLSDHSKLFFPMSLVSKI